MQVRRLIQGSTQLLISVPHAGTFLPPDIKSRLSAEGARLPDTDWHVDRLYDFASDMGIGLLTATHSRYVVDLNRAQEDTDLYPGQVKTGLCPLQSFDGADIYQLGEEPDAVEKANRITAYWMPYHDAISAELQRLKDRHGYAILYDAHSIRSEVPRLFDGVLPDLNIGTAHGVTCAPGMAETALKAAQNSKYSSVLNGRFVGGYITRHYGNPSDNIHTIQMELAWKNYMDEKTFLYDEAKAEKLRGVLKEVLSSIVAWGAKAYE